MTADRRAFLASQGAVSFASVDAACVVVPHSRLGHSRYILTDAGSRTTARVLGCTDPAKFSGEGRGRSRASDSSSCPSGVQIPLRSESDLAEAVEELLHRSIPQGARTITFTPFTTCFGPRLTPLHPPAFP